MSLEQMNFPAPLRSAPAPSSHGETSPMEVSNALDGTPPRPLAPTYCGSKRALDLVLCAGGLLVFWPVIGLIALTIKVDSRGPILFKQSRPGFEGQEFKCLKFRTMITNAEEVLHRHPDLVREFEQTGKIRDDPRVTRIGKILRKTSMDELPQIWNILVGQMSLVGPRPIVWSQEGQYGPLLQKLYSVKPGLAGLWQVEGRSETTMEERIALDMEYVDTCCLKGDIKLLLRTLHAVVARRGAF